MGAYLRLPTTALELALIWPVVSLAAIEPITGMNDAQGNALTNNDAIEGIRINSREVDPVSFVAVVPEPATLAPRGLGSLILLRTGQPNGSIRP